MSEDRKSLEFPYQREQVIQAFQKLTAKGFTNPDDLPLKDPEVLLANSLLKEWSDQHEADAKNTGTLAANLQFRLERSTILIDAGFTDPNYLDEVANDWLAQDLQEAENAGLTDIVSKIQARIEEIQGKLS